MFRHQDSFKNIRLCLRDQFKILTKLESKFNMLLNFCIRRSLKFGWLRIFGCTNLEWPNYKKRARMHRRS